MVITKKSDFNNIESSVKNYKFTSMAYTDYADVNNYEIKVLNDNLILIYGFNVEAKMYEYHFAANEVTPLAEQLKNDKDFFITFIPDTWVTTLEKAGLRIRNAWHEYFNKDLSNVIPCRDFEFLTIKDCEEASNLTMLCKNQSRGFTGQTPHWIKEWITNPDNVTNTKNNAILVERNESNEIIGLLCTGTYGDDIENGHTVWIRELAVRPDYQNKGIGRKLLTKALAYGKSFGVTKSFLAVDEDNKVGIHLYKSVGFLPSSEDSQIDMIKD